MYVCMNACMLCMFVCKHLCNVYMYVNVMYTLMLCICMYVFYEC